MKRIRILPLVLLALSCLSCPTEVEEPKGLPQDPMTGQIDIIYLHHSTGGVIWGGGVAEDVADHNAAHATNYNIAERAYPSGDPYPWNNYPYDYWNIWVNHAGPSQFEQEDTLELLTPIYEVIVFKHCFPVSGIGADSGAADVSSEDKQLQNYQLQYEALKTKMRQFPDTRFIVWTGAALTSANTSPEAAALAQTFFAWVRDVWDEAGDNIYVWDFWTLETEGGLYLRAGHAASLADSHPNEAFARETAPLFVNRLVDVIEGRGDTGSMTGEN